MQSNLKNRIGYRKLEANAFAGLLDYAKYLILAFVSLWASARFADFSMQFLALAVILGLKWVFESQKQVIQIFTQERG
jgi:hypothetical protein